MTIFLLTMNVFICNPKKEFVFTRVHTIFFITSSLKYLFSICVVKCIA